jgi:two-component system response regulator FixJ
MELLKETRRVAPEAPVIMLVNQGDIQTAVRAIKAGAADCLERPLETDSLLSAIDMALQKSTNGGTRRSPLSETERQVLHLMLLGYTNAVIARTLSRSRRTVEVHRSHIMRKLDVEGMVDLVRKCARLGLLEDWP